MNPDIQLNDHQKKELRTAIHDYYLNEFDEDIGIIRQDGLLELFMERLAPVIYDKALDDAKNWFARCMEDAESDYYLLYRENRS